jgi:chromosome partitioning protein
MTKIIAITNQKGGVGKTTTALNLGTQLAFSGRRVLAVDMDPQGQCAIGLGLNPEPCTFNLLVNSSFEPRQWIRPSGRKGLDLIPGDRSTATAQIVINAENRPLEYIRDLLRPLREYQYIFLDTAPSVGGIQERAIFAADYVLIPTATEFFSTNGLGQVITTMDQLAKKGWEGKLLGILPTFYDEVSTESKETMQELIRNFGEAVLPPIHRTTLLREAPAEGKVAHELDPQHRATHEYHALSQHVLKFS